MSLKVNDLISVIKNKIEQYNDKPSFQKDDQGYVVSVGDGIAFVYGLSGVMYGELVLFEKERVYGLALNLEENLTGVIIIGSDENIREYDIVKRQNELIKTSFDQKILGSIINVFGESIYGDEIYVNNQNLIQLNKERRELKKEATNIMMRESVSEPLETGILAIDALIPIGKGQRELIIGDRQTGKTSIAIDTIINQKDKNVLCIYVAIGQKKSDIVQIVEKLKQNDAFSYTVVLAANAADPVALQYLAPYTGASIAEA
jgi:F-type H+/Na+-transporting ATPase subunit alpha